MKVEARAFLKNAGLSDVNEKALYLLIHYPRGIPLENLSPLLGGLERAYRTLFSVSADPFLRDRIETFTTRRFRGPLTRSINARYSRYVSNMPQRHASDEAESDSVAVKGGVSESSLGWFFDTLIDDEPAGVNCTALSSEGSRKFYARRVEITRARISSPGFMEILGDTLTLAAILTFLSGLLQSRRRKRHDLQEAPADKWRNARVLRELGFSSEQTAGLYEYLEHDLGTVLRELEQGRIELAPGEGLEAGCLFPLPESEQ